MSIRTSFLRILFIALSCQIALAAAAMKVQHPVDKTYVNEPYISIVVQADTTALDMLVVSVDANSTYPLFVASPKQTYCKSVTLNLGENTLYITGYSNKKVVSRETLKVYYTSPVYKAYKYAPADFTPAAFHLEENERSCKTCHDMGVNEVANVAFEDITDSNCYDCHKAITKRQHGHAPAVNWLCTSCHDGKQGKIVTPGTDASRFSTANPVADTCFSCHEKSKDKWWDKRFHHEPADSGFCNRCHNPHSSENAFFLRKNTWDLCVTCHADKIPGTNHIVGVFGRQNHPTHGVADPSRPGKQLTCSSCHYPHGSDAGFLLRSKTGGVYGLCVRCHKK